MLAILQTSTTTPEPSPSPSGIIVEQQECFTEADGFCRVVYDLTGNEGLAHVADWLVARPLAIVLIVFLAWLGRWILHRFVDRVVRRIAAGKPAAGMVPRRARKAVATVTSPLTSPLVTARRQQRSEAVGSVLKSVASFVIAIVATLMILSELGLNVAPAIASAGIAGVALGFGAQNLVKDFLAGIFMIFEDQYGVGDIIDTGEASGTVEGVGLRVTQLRDVNGVVWYVRNGEIVRIGNESQGWARVVLDVAVSPRADIDVVREVLQQTADALWQDEEWAPKIVEQPQLWGIESVTPDAVTVRVTVKTVPADRPSVTRELRDRVRTALDERGIEMPTALGSLLGRAAGTPPSA